MSDALVVQRDRNLIEVIEHVGSPFPSGPFITGQAYLRRSVIHPARQFIGSYVLLTDGYFSNRAWYAMGSHRKSPPISTSGSKGSIVLKKSAMKAWILALSGSDGCPESANLGQFPEVLADGCKVEQIEGTTGAAQSQSIELQMRLRSANSISTFFR